MDALTQSSLAAAGLLDSPPSGSARNTDSQITTAAFDGLQWTALVAFQRVLSATPASVWVNPQRQPGWTRVKENARREVWRAEVGDAAYYLKYFFRDPPGVALKHLFRPPPCRVEWNSGLFAIGVGIPAVRPLGFTERLLRNGRVCSMLISEAVDAAVPLNEFWLQLQSDEDVPRRRQDLAQLTERLAIMIARAHQAGFEHLDMHAENILVETVGPRQYRPLFVDLQSSRLGVPIRDRAVVRNLAQLNQWFGRNSSLADRLRFLRAYFRWRNEFEVEFHHGRALGLTFEELLSELWAAARRHSQRLWRQRDRRIYRNGSYFKRIRLAGGWRGMVVARCKHPDELSRAASMTFTREWWRGVLREPLHWFTDDATDSCKNSHSASVRRAVLSHEAGPLPVIFKRPLARNWHRRLASLFGETRCARAWRNGHALLHRDLATARPLAVLERRLGPLRLDSLIITEAIPGAVDLETWLKRAAATHTPAEWAALKRDWLPLLVRHVRRLRERGIAHRDCKASNILVRPLPVPRVLWIDMDGMRVRRRKLTRSEEQRPLMRLHVSLGEIPGLTRTDRARFLKLYLAGFGASPAEWRTWWRELSPRIEVKQAAQRKRREWKLRNYGRL